MRFIRKKILFRLFQLALIVAVFAYPTAIEKVSADEISKLVLSKNALNMEMGDTQTLTATAIFVSGSTSDVTIRTDWTSNDDRIASVYSGTVTAKAEGQTFLSASYMGKTVVVTVNVSKKIKSLAKDKQSLVLRAGETEPVKLTATYTDGTTNDVTTQAEWASDDPNVASVVNGSITGQGSGEATITAKLGNQTISIPVDVDVIRRLDPDLTTVVLRGKGTQQIKLMALFADALTEDVADKAEWSTDNENVADAVKGLITAYGTGHATVTAKFGGKTATIGVDVDIAKRLEAVPSSLFMRVNESKPLQVTATYADGQTQDVTALAEWSSDHDAIADVDKGIVASYAVGQAVLTARYGTKAISIPVDVGTGKKLEINKQRLFLHHGDTEQLTLTATYADGTPENVTSQAEWTSSSESVAYVSKGKISAYGAGSATITAKYGDKTITVPVDVDVARKLVVSKQDLSLKVGDSEQLTLTATYADGNTENVTDKAEWTSNNEAAAFVNQGKVSAFATGGAMITAKYSGLSATVMVDVDVPRRLQVSKQTVALQDGASEQVTVDAIYADGRIVDVTNQAVWKSSVESVAEVSKGFINAIGTGTTTVTVQYGKRTATIAVSVGQIDRVTASETKITLEQGGSKQITLTAAFADGSIKDVTAKAVWSSALETVASVRDGMITANASGKTNITVTYGGKSLTIPVEVDIAQSLSADTTKVVMGINETKQIILTATFTQGTSKDVTANAEWQSYSTNIADVTKGKVSANGNGRTTISAKYGGKTITIPVEVEVVQKLELDKRYLSLKTGQQARLVLQATYSNGVTKNVSNDADWTTRSYKIADVADGLVTATGSGNTTVTAKYGGKMLTIPIEVDTLKYLKTNEVRVDLVKGQSKKVNLIATYLDGSEKDVSIPALWSSSRLLVADAKDGIIKANGIGQATITATFGGKRATILVIVR